MQGTTAAPVRVYKRDGAWLAPGAAELGRLGALRRMYERLVPVALDARLPLLPMPTVRRATVLFTDVRGFTGLAERLRSQPERLLAILNEHLEVAVRAVTRCGGAVEKFMGDGLFASFGARADDPDHAQRALAAAMAVVGANEALNRRRARHWGFRLEVGVGLSTGRVIVGTLGSMERCELGILGDPVNVAARLTAESAPGEVLMCPGVYREAEGSVAADLLGNRAVRGREGRLDLYRLRLIDSGCPETTIHEREDETCARS